jgi:replication factor C subunit 3/5
VKEYAKKRPLNVFSTQKVFKTVLINNVDRLSYYAQTSLRRTMEKYSGTCRFIMWCSSLSKIIDPLISRCLSFRISAPSEPELLEYILNICYKEKIKLPLTKIQEIINKSNGNIKKILWSLESHKELPNNEPTQTSYEETIDLIFKYIKTGNNSTIWVIRELLYKILITNIKGTDIIRDLVDKLINSKKILDVNKYLIIEKSAKFEHNLIKGRREIIHLEVFIQSVLKIIYNNKSKTIK